MADLIGSGSSDKDTDKVLVSLKKGAQLFKYGRKGKPKFCPFRLSNDESSLIWISNRGEKELKLATVLRIIPGQRTAVFRRFSCREKEYLSFSLIYKNGERSLDLICKDKTEAEAWFAGLKALIAAGQGGRSKIDGCGWRQEGILEDGRDLSSNSFSDSSLSASLDISSPESSVFASTSSNRNSAERSTIFDKSDATNMYMKGASSDVLRISTSSAPSSSSHGSGQDDCDSLGDVYIWGEVICDISTRAGSDKYNPSISGKVDVLLPRPLEANTVLDVQYVACGVRHAALITRQGEVFTWGEESGGRLGHGFGSDAIHPRLLEPLSASNVDFVSCGEFHTCAVTLAGDLYTWGDGKHYAGVLGHGNDVSHCVPKRVSGSLEGIQVSYVACGTWHTAIITSAGQLFTFGDGTFGVLGHGDRESCAYPREVESLKGLCTLTVACGVWHMAAVVEVIMTQSSASVSSGKLFTWGDGDKYRLGHGDKEPRLKPTCAPSLIDYNFQKVACGHSLTIGLTTQGRIFSMGSTVYGQLGNPLSDGKSPCLVEDKLSSEYVAEVSCGSYHVAVLTTRNEVYTWGNGANGRLGHGDIEDRKMPTLVETLKDRPVKQIACGLNFTAAICPHKWVSGADQSQCSSCRQPFGFTRKRHNCYNCGLVHCHSCSSKKALRAALSPNPAKPYRVCDSCYLKLTKMVESNALNIKRISSPFFAGEKVEAKTTKISTSSNMDLTMLLDSKATKHGKKIEPMPLIRSPLPMDSNQTFSRAGCQTGTHSLTNSRANSPFSRTLSPPRSITPIPTTSGLSITKTVADSLKETNETLNKQVQQLRAEVESLRQHCELQELELQKSAMRAREAIQLAAEESAKTKAAKEVLKSLTAQLKDVAERLPAGAYDMDRRNPMYPTDETKNDVNGGAPLRNELLCNAPITPLVKPSGNGTQRLVRTQREYAEANEKGAPLVSWRSVGPNDGMEREYSYGIVQMPDRVGLAYVKEADSLPYYSNNSKTRSQSCDMLQTETEWLEQYEPGVYITLGALPDGSRDLKRVRFSRRRFGEHQAESWWSANREKVYEKYNVRAIDKSPTAPPA